MAITDENNSILLRKVSIVVAASIISNYNTLAMAYLSPIIMVSGYQCADDMKIK